MNANANMFAVVVARSVIMTSFSRDNTEEPQRISTIITNNSHTGMIIMTQLARYLLYRVSCLNLSFRCWRMLMSSTSSSVSGALLGMAVWSNPAFIISFPAIPNQDRIEIFLNVVVRYLFAPREAFLARNPVPRRTGLMRPHRQRRRIFVAE